ncbi:MAG: MTAP family purine nucleoside phosphorylase [Planctomycetes bacterium]|nr:MTAP family purine nucleoside phosphorylase [Planctomycetota bacterium]
MSDEFRVALIGGTGLGERLGEGMAPEDLREYELDTPFGAPSSKIVTGRFGDVPVAILQRHGPGHLLNPAHVPYRANIYALKALGCTHCLASGATGSLREEIAPGDLVICDQLIDRTVGRDRTFYEHAAVHVEFASPFCPVMRRWLLDHAADADSVRVHDGGTYVCMEGPSFSTRAESNLHRQFSADVVGMTALPEARLAREAEMAYALIALPTDYDCWRPHATTGEASLLEEIIGNLNRATDASIALIRAALSDVSALRAQPSSAHSALALAIWSDKSMVPPDEVRRLDVLWGRYFE